MCAIFRVASVRQTNTAPPSDETRRLVDQMLARLRRDADWLAHFDRTPNPFADELEDVPATDAEGMAR